RRSEHPTDPGTDEQGDECQAGLGHDVVDGHRTAGCGHPHRRLGLLVERGGTGSSLLVGVHALVVREAGLFLDVPENRVPGLHSFLLGTSVRATDDTRHHRHGYVKHHLRFTIYATGPSPASFRLRTSKRAGPAATLRSTIFS